MENAMKIGLNIVASAFTFVLSLACLAGCATSTEPTDDETTGEETTRDETPAEAPPTVASGTLKPTACGYSSATCAMAISKCPNPRLGGTYCYIAQQCFACY
jgi:hypothetical protein